MKSFVEKLVRWLIAKYLPSCHLHKNPERIKKEKDETTISGT